MAKKVEYTRYTVRFPTRLYERLQAASGEASVNAEVVARLEASFNKTPPTLSLAMQTLPNGSRPERVNLATFTQVFNETMRRVLEEAQAADRQERREAKAAAENAGPTLAPAEASEDQEPAPLTPRRKRIIDVKNEKPE